MGAFILATLVFAGTVALSLLVLFGDAMSDTTGNGGTSAFWLFGAGTLVSILIIASHWMPPIGW